MSFSEPAHCRWSYISFVASLLFLLTSPASASIQYQVSIAHPEQHLFHVTMVIPDVTGELTVEMPAWNALYEIRDFSSHVQHVEASNADGTLPIVKLDKQTWRITGAGTITVRYATFWDEVGPFAAQLNSEHAFINPAMLLLYVSQRRQEAVQFSLTDVPAEWRVASPAIEADEATPVHLNSYDELADSPIEAGHFLRFNLLDSPVPIQVVVHGKVEQRQQMENTLRQICRYELALMGGAPFKRYLFIFHIGENVGGGGMEHANATAISISNGNAIATVSAHEFFHLWNVKRIRPASLEPIDYSKEQYTRSLWFAEGVTSTYGSYTLVRSGLWSKETFYADLSQQISELESRPANRWQSAEQSSLDTWLENYPIYNRPEHSVSYYTKGQVLGVLLDLWIRKQTKNGRSLDDLLRALNEQFAKTGTTYRDGTDLQAVCEQVSGTTCQDFFREYVAGTKPFPYDQYLAFAGLSLELVKHSYPALGFVMSRDSHGRLSIASVNDPGSTAADGLRVGDEILEWNSEAPPRDATLWLQSHQPGDRLKLRVRRMGGELSIEILLKSELESHFEIKENRSASKMELRIRNGILHGTTEKATESNAAN